MNLLPVIDLLGGLVVRGVAGRREEYRELRSQLTADVSPRGVASAFREKARANDVYVADLDAIAGHEPDWNSLAEIAAAGLTLWIDAGAGNVARARQLAEYAERTGALAAIVVGLESVPSLHELRAVFASIGPDLAVFSLDLREGLPLTDSPSWRGQDPLEVAGQAVEVGFRRLIVLDLCEVGMDQGPSVAPLCAALRSLFPHLEITSGGGVRGQRDVDLLASAGCNRVLVASALHSLALPAI